MWEKGSRGAMAGAPRSARRPRPRTALFCQADPTRMRCERAAASVAKRTANTMETEGGTQRTCCTQRTCPKPGHRNIGRGS